MALLFFKSDTTGEKILKVFNENEDLDMDRFDTVGVIRNKPDLMKQN